jgi:hypothetical protein
MRSHLVLLVTFAFFVSLVFALLSRDSPRDQARFGGMLMVGFLAAGILLGWIMYLFPL